MFKSCPKCAEENKDDGLRPYTEFHKNSSTKTGLQTYCKDHQRDESLKSYYRRKQAVT